MTGGRKRSSARIWALGMGLIVLVIGAALMGGLSMRLGVTPAPQIHRTGTAVVTTPCERDPLNLLMYRCQAQVESWTATAASAPDLDPAMTVTVYSAKPLQGPVTIQSHPLFAGDGREVVTTSDQWRMPVIGTVGLVCLLALLPALAMVLTTRLLQPRGTLRAVSV